MILLRWKYQYDEELCAALDSECGIEQLKEQEHRKKVRTRTMDYDECTEAIPLFDEILYISSSYLDKATDEEY